MIPGASASAVSASRWHSSCTKRTRCLNMLKQKMRWDWKNTMTSTSSLQSSKKEWGWREWNFKNSRYSNVAMQPWASESIYLHKNCLIQTQMLSPRPDPVEYDPCHGLGSGHAVDCYPSPQRACSKSSEKLTVLTLPFCSKKNVFPTHFFRIWWVWRSSKIWRIFQIREGTPTASRLGCRCKSLAQVLEFKESISICFHMKLYKHKNNKYPAKIHFDKCDHHGFTMNHPVLDSRAPLLTGCPGLACWTATSWRWPFVPNSKDKKSCFWYFSSIMLYQLSDCQAEMWTFHLPGESTLHGSMKW